MAYAALILAHRDVPQVLRLADRLGCSCWVHYDAKSPWTDMVQLARAETINLVPQPLNVRWGHWSTVEATLRGLRAAAGDDPDHILVLSGQTYPLRPREEIERRLSEPVSFIHYNRLPRPEWAWHHGGVDRVRYWWTERRSWMPQRLPAMVRLPVRRRLPPVPLYGGSQWIVLHRSAYQYVLGLPEDHPVNRAMRHALLPDELYFHTVLANSHLRPTLVRDNLHFIKWGGREHPDVLTEQDLAAIEAEGKLFARKFTADDPLLDIIDERLLGPGLSSSGSR